MKGDLMKGFLRLGSILVVLSLALLPEAQSSGRFDDSRSRVAVEVVVTGKVTDESTGEGLPGVTVLEKGTSNGTITDFDGNFKLTVADNSTLTFSFVGFETQEIAVGQRGLIDVSLVPDVQALEEVVVIGYGEVKRADITGSVVSMDAKSLEKVNKVDAVSALQGQVPGVVIQRTDNKPGSGGFNIRIRGASTINSNAGSGAFSPGQNPLFIVDGIFVDDISFLNPADIDRIDVLKDASATAIYGARGSNGVVIIKTKRGSKGKVTVRYNNYVGVRQAYNLPKIFDTPGYLEFLRDVAVGREFNSMEGDLEYRRTDVDINDYLSEEEQTHIAEGVNTDWVDLMLKDGIQNNHTLDISGGNEKTIYGIGFGYTKDDGNIDGEDFTRYNLRGNFSSDLTEFLNISYNNYITAAIQNTGSWEAFRSAYRLKPFGKPYNEDGTLRFRPTEKETQITNPLYDTENVTRETRYLQYLADISLKITPIEGVSLTTKFSPNLKYTRYGEYRGRYSKSVSGNVSNTIAQANNFNDFSYTWDNILNYDVSFGGKQKISATLVYSRYLQRNEAYNSEVRGFTTDDYLFYNLDAGPEVRDVSSELLKQSIESYTARLNYALMDKYLFTVTGRYDGASILSENNKWAFFPSAAFAWRLGEESFMQSVDFVSDAKIRVSYGQTGNNGAGGGLVPLSSVSLISSSFTSLDGTATQSAYIPSLANPELSWETTTEFNLGVDYGFMKNRIFGSIDVYNRNVEDIIFSSGVPYVTGFSGIFQNIGEANNKGIEFGLNAVIVDNGDWKWTTNLNFAKNVNKITRLDGGRDIFYGANGASLIHRVGEAIGAIYDYEFDGIWNLDEAEEAALYGQRPGQVKVKDLNGDNAITPEDRTIIGNLTPSWTGGLTSTLNYKDWDFSFFINTSQGNTQMSTFLRAAAFNWDSDPSRLFNGYDVDYWTPESQSQEYFQPGNGGQFNHVIRYRDVSYTKIGYITLGYTVPNNWLQTVKISHLRVYVTAQNPFVFTDYVGFDPESTGRDHWGASFMARSFIGGLNLTF